MSKAEGLRTELNTTLDELRTLRDEVRLQLHLAGMDAKDKWNREIEPKLFSMEKEVERDVGTATRTALHELAESMKEFRQKLERQSKH